jgi:hypothetical protein
MSKKFSFLYLLSELALYVDKFFLNKLVIFERGCIVNKIFNGDRFFKATICISKIAPCTFSASTFFSHYISTQSVKKKEEEKKINCIMLCMCIFVNFYGREKKATKSCILNYIFYSIYFQRICRFFAQGNFLHFFFWRVKYDNQL